MMHELLPRHKIGDVILYRSEPSLEDEELLVQAKILGAKARLEDDKWIWSYHVEPVDGNLAIFLEDQHIVANLDKETI